MRQIKAPFLIVNPKSYLYGEKSLQLALAADRAAEQYGIDIFFTCPYSDLRLIKEHTKHLILTAQHMDSLVPGRGMGYVLPEALRDAGVEAVFLNHAEHPLTVNELYKTMKRAEEMGIATIVCADSVAEGIALSRLHPTVILCEPTDLIGEAYALLQRGVTPAECAVTCGYADQAHLTRSLRLLHGETPARILAGR